MLDRTGQYRRDHCSNCICSATWSTVEGTAEHKRICNVYSLPPAATASTLCFPCHWLWPGSTPRPSFAWALFSITVQKGARNAVIFTWSHAPHSGRATWRASQHQVLLPIPPPPHAPVHAALRASGQWRGHYIIGVCGQSLKAGAYRDWRPRTNPQKQWEPLDPEVQNRSCKFQPNLNPAVFFVLSWPYAAQCSFSFYTGKEPDKDFAYGWF